MFNNHLVEFLKVACPLLQASYHWMELSITYCIIVPCTCLTSNISQVVFPACFSRLFLLCAVLCSVVSDSLRPHGLCSPPGSSVPEILQARTLQWVAMPSSRGSSQPRDRTCISFVYCIDRQILYHLSHQGIRL